MIEIITAIALLCQVSPSTGEIYYFPSEVDKYQLKCQQEYIECISKKVQITDPESHLAARLMTCTYERKVK